MTKQLRYLHVVDKISPQMKQGLEEVPRRSGMYNWMFLFKGGITQFRDLDKKEIEEYDVIQVNLAPADQLLVREVKKLIGPNSSTLLVGNNDYIAEYWDQWGQHPNQYKHVQEECDALFGTEEHQVSQMIDGAYCIPHPTWTKMLKKIGNDDIDRSRYKVGVMYHWWEGRTYTQSSVLAKLRQEYPRLSTRLYGYSQDFAQMDRSRAWQKQLFDKRMPVMGYPQFILSLQTNRFFYENCTYHTYGRTSVDTACLEVPTLGSDRVFSMRHCWPEMCCDPFNAKKQLEIMRKTLEGGEWLQKQLDHAWEAVEYFNYDNSRERYLKMIDETRERLGR
jgi:hypothetical protein